MTKTTGDDIGDAARKKQLVRYGLRLLISIVILAVLISRIDMKESVRAVLSLDPILAGLALVMIFIESFVVAAVWRLLLKDKGVPVRMWDMLRVIFASDFIGTALPTSLGSDVIKVAGISRSIDDRAGAFSSLVMFRFIGLEMLFVFAAVTAIGFNGRLPDGIALILVVMALAVPGVIALSALIFAGGSRARFEGTLQKIRLGGVYEKLMKAYDAFLFYLRLPRALAATVVGGTFVQVNKIIYMIVVSYALGLSIEPSAFFVFVPLVTVLIMLPVSLAGIGVREGGYIFLFGLVGLSSNQAFSLSICGFAINLLYVLLCGIIYWIAGFPERE